MPMRVQGELIEKVLDLRAEYNFELTRPDTHRGGSSHNHDSISVSSANQDTSLQR